MDDCGSNGWVVASPDVAFVKLVLINNLPHLFQKLMLGDGTPDQIVLQSSSIQDSWWDRLLDKLLH